MDFNCDCKLWNFLLSSAYCIFLIIDRQLSQLYDLFEFLNLSINRLCFLRLLLLLLRILTIRIVLFSSFLAIFSFFVILPKPSLTRSYDFAWYSSLGSFIFNTMLLHTHHKTTYDGQKILGSILLTDSSLFNATEWISLAIFSTLFWVIDTVCILNCFWLPVNAIVIEILWSL